MKAAVKFIRTIRSDLSEGRVEPAFKRLRGALSASSFPTTLRPRILEMAAAAFLKGQHFLKVAEIYNQMVQENYIPSFSLRTRIMVLDVLSQSPSKEALLESLDDAFRLPQFDEACFRDLLRFLWTILKCSHDVLDSVVANYVRVHDPNYPLSEATQSLIARIRLDVISQEASIGGLPASILTLPAEPPSLETVHYLSAANFGDDALFYDALKPWIHAGAGLRCCNALIATQIRRSHYDKAFRIYEIIRSTNEPSLIPNDTTFKMLFQSYSTVRKPRNFRSRRIKSPVDVFTPRELFRDMLRFHSLQKDHKLPRSITSSRAVLDQALQVFMDTHDYAAAFVTIRAYTILRLPLTLELYRIVLSSLLKRVQWELGRVRESTVKWEYWSYRFLGYPEVMMDVDTEMLKRVMRYGESAHLNLTGQEDAVKDTDIPSTAEVLSAQDALQVNVKPKPLERILRRAMLANHVALYSPAAKEVSLAIREAKAEMIPT